MLYSVAINTPLASGQVWSRDLGVNATTHMLHVLEALGCLYRSCLIGSSMIWLVDKCHEALNILGHQCVRRFLSPTCFPIPHHSYYLSLRCWRESVKVTGVCNVASFRLVGLTLLSALARFQATFTRLRVQAVSLPDLQFTFPLFRLELNFL